MATVRLDLVRGNAGKLSDAGWDNLNRTALVENLTAVNGYDRIHEAIYALANLFPSIQIGSVHPADQYAICESITPETMEPTKIAMKITYKSKYSPTAAYNIGGSVQSEQVNTNVDFEDIQLQYTYPEDYAESERAGTTEVTGAIISKHVPRTVIDANRLELYNLGTWDPITYQNVLARAKYYQGKVNEGSWNVDPSALPGTWLCTQCSGVTNDFGFSFNMSYGFVYRPEGWMQHVVFIDPNTGKPAKDLVVGESDKWIQVYESANFDALLL